MANGLNQCLFLGNLTHTPETIRYTQKGTAILDFTLAVNEYDSGKQNNQHVEFIKVTVFGGWCEFVTKHCQKGDTLLVQGRIRQEKYTPSRGKYAGQERVMVKLLADKLEPIRLKKWSGPQEQRQSEHPPHDEEMPPIPESDPPF